MRISSEGAADWTSHQFPAGSWQEAITGFGVNSPAADCGLRTEYCSRQTAVISRQYPIWSAQMQDNEILNGLPSRLPDAPGLQDDVGGVIRPKS